MKTLDPVIKEQWVDALRSGDYRQGTGQLKHSFNQHSTDYCCLGVLCDISPEISWVGDSARFVDDPPVFRDTGTVPQDYAMKIGLHGRQGHLIGLNDQKGLTFDEIADYIEEYL